MEIEVGTKNVAQTVVCEENCAKNVGSGSLMVFATPSMVALMEKAASQLCDKYIDEDLSTVGTQMNVSHLAASALGAKITAEAIVTYCDDRKVCFDVKAYDEKGLIGEGTHERFCVKVEKFMSRAQARLGE